MNQVSVVSGFQPDNVVVEGVDWAVDQHDFWVIGGLHGSGKTDLLLTAAGLQRPSQGTVVIFGNEQGTLDEKGLLEERRRIGVVFENGGRMFRQLTVRENVALPLRYHENLTEKASIERISAIIDATGLTPFIHNTIGTLSPPWQQRVGLARALAMDPELLLIDKPSIGARYLPWWQGFLKKLHDGSIFGGRRMTVVLTAEDFRDWSQIGTHFAMVKKKHWRVLGGKAELAESQEELWRDVTSEIAI